MNARGWPAAVAVLLSGGVLLSCSGPIATRESARDAGRDRSWVENLPVRGLHVLVSGDSDLDVCERFVQEVLPAEGVNVLVAEINYHYQYASHPEVVSDRPLQAKEVRRLAEACRKSGVKFVPQINCLGHQSWAGEKGALLKAFPEFDETPWIPDGQRGFYSRSYCPLHPEVHGVVFGLIDELADVSDATDFHVGMDEVFAIAEEKCPRCSGRNPADLYAGEANALRDHLAAKGRTMWMWGDRLLDAETHGVGMMEASANGTHPAVDRIPKDIIICDWHYEKVPLTLAHLVEKGFRVIACPWRVEAVALHQLAAIQRIRRRSDLALGVMQTTWGEFEEFVRAYHGESDDVQAVEVARCFRTLFAAIREGDERLAVAEAAQERAAESAPMPGGLRGQVVAEGRYRVVLGGSEEGFEEFTITRTAEGHHLAAHGVPPSVLEVPFDVTLSVAPDRSAWEAQFRERVAVPMHVRYSLAGSTGMADGELGGLEVPRQEIAVDEGAALVGPSYASWGFALPRGLETGDSAQLPIVLFGMGSWQMMPFECTVTRNADEQVVLGDGSQADARHYELQIATPMGPLPGEGWTNADGVVLRLRVVTSVGPIDATLESPLVGDQS